MQGQLALTGRLGVILIFAALATGPTVAQQGRTEADARALSEFNTRVQIYLKQHHQAERGLPEPKSTKLASDITRREHLLAAKIRTMRGPMKIGSIFTPAVSAYFTRLIQSAYQADAGRIKNCLSYETLPELNLQPNDIYPEDQPYPTMPATLLLHLPKLPRELEYRIVCKDLVLRDVEANLIVDVMRNAIPPAEGN